LLALILKTFQNKYDFGQLTDFCGFFNLKHSLLNAVKYFLKEETLSYTKEPELINN
jgi:hypothetical protein